MLFRKLLRTALRYKAQFISMIIMIGLGLGVFVGFNMEWVSIEKNIDYAFKETGFADFRLVNESGFSEEDAKSVASIPGVEDTTRFLAVNTVVKGGTDVITLTVSENINVSGFLTTSGEGYDGEASDKIWLSDQYAERNGISVGDQLSLSYRDVTLETKVAGLVKSGEYLICLPDDSLLMPDFDSYGFAYVSPAAFKKAAGYEFYTQINVISGLTKEEFSEKANVALGRTTLVVSKDDTVSYSEAMGESEEGKTMGSVLPVLFIAIAVLTMVTTMHRITANEKTQIGTLKSLGFTDRRILVHYSSYALFIGVVGTVLGAGIGYGLAYYIMNPNGAMGTYLDMPQWKLYMPSFAYIVIVGVIAFLTFIGFLSVKKMLKGSAADALRPYSPKAMRKLRIENTRLWNKFGFGTRWNLRDVLRHPSRSLMTLFGVVGCTVLLVGGLGMRDTMDDFVGVFYDKAINYEYRLNISKDADKADAFAAAEKYEGDWSAQSSVEIGDEAVLLEIYSVKHDKVRFIDEKMNVVPLSDDGAFICRRIANENGLKAGDTAVFSPYGTDKKYEVRVAGVTSSLSKSIVLSDALAEKLGIEYDVTSVYTDKAGVPTDGVVSSVQSKASIIGSFDAFMEIMNVMVFLLIAAAVILGLIVLYNLGVMSYVERYREMATLKVIGFNDRSIGRLLVSQNLWLSVLGTLIGMPLGWAVLEYLITALGSEYELRVYIGPLTYIISALLTLGVSVVVSKIISAKNKKIDMVSALKTEE